MTVIRIPTPLRPYTEGLKEVEVEGKTVGTVIHAVADQYPGIQPHIFDDEGNLRAYVNIFLNEENVRHLKGHDTPVAENDKLMIVPSIAGGSNDPESISLVDHAALRANQASIIILLIIAFIADLPSISLLVAIIMLIGTLLKRPGFLPVYLVLKGVNLIQPDIRRDHPEPHRFANGFGSIVLLIGFITFTINLPIIGWVLAWVVIILAGVNLFLGFCVGCAVYYWLNRFGVPFFHKEAPAGRIPGLRPQKEKHA